MRCYYVQMTVIIKLFLRGKIILSEKVYVSIPPIEKGVNEAVETLTEDIYDRIIDNIHNCVPDVEDLRVELLLENSSITARYEKQLVDQREIFDSDSAILDDRIKYCMVMIERELTKILAYISKHLYE